MPSTRSLSSGLRAISATKSGRIREKRVRDGEVVTATGRGRVAFIDADDIAAVAAHALTDPVAHNTEHILTGPQALTYDEAVTIVARHLGRPVRHRSVSADEHTERVGASGIPLEFARILPALDVGIAEGAEDRVTRTVEDVTGRPARTFEEFCARTFQCARAM